MKDTTTLKISKTTAEALKNIKKTLNVKSIDAAIQLLIKERHKAALEEMFGVDKGRIKSFSEQDRLEDR